MSSRPPHRPPAWAELAARTPVYVPAEPALADAVRSALQLSGSVQHLEGAGGHDAAFLRFEPASGDRALFVKVLAAHRDAAMLEAESIAGWLQRQGAAAVPGHRHGHLPDGRVVWSYPFLAGAPPRADRAQLAAIGTALARVHLALATHPEREGWQARTEARLAALTRTRRALADRSLAAGPDPTRLAALAADASTSFLPADHPGKRAPLHGDLNLFNMVAADGGFVFLDWEDVAHSVLPPVFDLATVFERVVLVNEAARGRETALLVELLDAYEDAAGTRIPPATIAPALRGLALRALCTLAASDPEGADEREWRKFFHLLDLGATLPM